MGWEEVDGGLRGEVATGAGEDCDGDLGHLGDLAEGGTEEVVAIEVEGVEFLGAAEGDCCDVLWRVS